MTEPKKQTCPTVTPNKTTLASLVGVSRTTITRASRMDGFPQRTSEGWNVKECRAFVTKYFAIKADDSLAGLKVRLDSLIARMDEQV
jgi:hypothetical protein